jgi:hypothetical protein
VKLRSRRDLPSTRDLADLQSTFATLVFFLQFADGRIYSVSIFAKDFREKLRRDRFVRNKDERLDDRNQLRHTSGRLPFGDGLFNFSFDFFSFDFFGFDFSFRFHSLPPSK